jgi:hypothetical protein
VISIALATQLQLSGLRWDPAPGDRFSIPQPGLEGEIFTISEMTIEAHDYPTGTVLGFNGTTEWAMDSVEQEQALWLPREDQLRELLGGTFRRLERSDAGELCVVVRSHDGTERRFVDADAAEAYGAAVLALLDRVYDRSPGTV